GVITTDDTGLVKQMNKIAEELTGWKESEAAGKQLFKVFKIIDEATRKVVENPVSNILKEGKVVGLANHTILISKTGRETPIADSGAPIINESGEITGVVIVFHDKTIEHNSENLIRMSEARLNRAEIVSKSGNWELHLDTMKIIGSDGASKIYGVGVKELSLDVVQKFCLPEYRELLDNALKNLLEKNEPYDIEFKIKSVDTGTIKDIRSVAKYDPVKKILFGVIQDITDRKQAQEALRENEAFLNNLLETIPIPIFFKDSHGKYLGVNKAFISFSGYAKEQFIGKNVFDIYPPKQAEIYFTKDSELIRDGGVQVYQSIFISADDKHHEVVFHKAAYKRNNLETAGIIGVILDITESINAEKAIKKSIALYHDLVETSQDLIWQCDAEGRYIFLNHAWEEVLGYKIEEMLGKRFSDFQTKEYAERDLKEFERLIEGGTVKGLETVHISKDGKELALVFNAKFVKDEYGNVTGTRGTAYDRTERKRAEDALIDSERLLKESQAVAKLGSYVWDLPIGIWKSSKILDDVFGIDKNYERTLEGWGALIHPDWQARMNDYVVNEVIGKKQRFEKEYKIIRQSDGEVRWVYGLGELEFDKRGNPIKLIGTIQDITEKKVAEEALHESEEIFKHFMEFSPIYVFFKDENIRAVRLSDNYKTMLGKPIAELLGKNMDDLFPSDLAKSMVADDKRILIEGKEITIEEELNGRFYSTIKFPIFIDGNARYLAGYTIDITESKAAEKALKESEEKLSTLFASMTEMVALHEIVFDDNGEAVNYKIIDCNNAFSEITHIKREDAVGKLATEVYRTEEAPYLDLYSRVAVTQMPLEYITYYAPMDKHFSISVVSPKKNHFATITTDVTAIQQIQEIIKAKNQELENYLYVSSHDLRSPLVNIQGFSQRLQKHVDSINIILKDYSLKPESKIELENLTNNSIPETLDFIFTNVAKMENLISGLLQISRTGRVRMTISRININKLLRKIIGALDFQLTEISATVVVNELPDCYGDENLLNQLFTNIITNAIKYRKQNRPLVLDISAKVQYNKVVYAVSDNGTGIAARHLEKIWDVFYRIDSASLEAGEGIGLSISKRIADKHRGKIWAESEEGKGSIFYIELQTNVFEE
ncbi:MAG: PAS domain S-box protein, partial [Ignavibacteriaceae bacterium]|nr:PAS domain S-box protein [Ignavibacteriaceae bacterium]